MLDPVVRDMRMARNYMVQTVIQYIFIHRALLDALTELLLDTTARAEVIMSERAQAEAERAEAEAERARLEAEAAEAAALQQIAEARAALEAEEAAAAREREEAARLLAVATYENSVRPAAPPPLALAAGTNATPRPLPPPRWSARPSPTASSCSTTRPSAGHRRISSRSRSGTIATNSRPRITTSASR